MRIIFLNYLIFLLFASCCREKTNEIGRYELNPSQLALLPYKKGEKVNFVHSNGYTFDFEIEEELRWNKEYEFCEWLCCEQNYYSFQEKTIWLKSMYPRLHLSFLLTGSAASEYYPKVLNVNLNGQHYIQLPYDTGGNFICDSTTKTVCYDSILINERMFYDVVKADFEPNNVSYDSSAVVPRSLFFNKVGVVKLKMSNHETYTINP